MSPSPQEDKRKVYCCEKSSGRARKASLWKEEDSIVGEGNVFKNKSRDVYVRVSNESCVSFL